MQQLRLKLKQANDRVEAALKRVEKTEERNMATRKTHTTCTMEIGDAKPKTCSEITAKPCGCIALRWR